MGYVFVSCFREDQAFTDRLLPDLLQAGIDLWLAYEQVKPGVNWHEGIRQAIKAADGLIYIRSRRSSLDAYIATELGTAIANSIPVYALRIDNTELEKPLKVSRRIHWLDFRTNYDEALQQLLALLPASVCQNQPVEPVVPQAKGYIFISYAQEDSEFVKALRNFLKDRGYAYWDYQDSERDYHKHLPSELESVMLNASATICVLSPAWKESKWTQREYAFCDETNAPVFLVKIREMGPTLAVAGKLYIDFTRDDKTGFDKLDKELRRKGLI